MLIVKANVLIRRKLVVIHHINGVPIECVSFVALVELKQRIGNFTEYFPRINNKPGVTNGVHVKFMVVIQMQLPKIVLGTGKSLLSIL